MNEAKAMPYYKDGERKCPLCNDPLPAHQTWPGAHYRYCMKSECKQQLMAGEHHGWQYIEADTRQCDAEGCSNFLPEGRYANKAILTCSANCSYARSNAEKPTRFCACGCGQEIRRIREGLRHGSVYVSPQHMWKHRSETFLSVNTGKFKPIVDEYLAGFAETHYRDLGQVRQALAPFFRFLNDQNIRSLDAVTPKMITDFLAWIKSLNRGRLEIGYVKTFLDWAIEMGHRERANPIISSFHGLRRKKGAPRPYSTSEMEYIWALLDERGDARVRFAVAIAEEAGLRRGEICRLRVNDIDLKSQRCFVRLPNKTNCERYALFGEKTKSCFGAWMKVRNPACGHDALLYNDYGKKPLSPDALTRHLNLALCKTYLGEQVNKTGLEQFNLHRLRHTMATNLVRGGADMMTVMTNGGWKSYDAACLYAGVDLQIAQRGYDDAMLRVKARKNAPRTTRTLTPAELVARESDRLSKMYLGEVQREERPVISNEEGETA